jgi:hypothetical protein
MNQRNKKQTFVFVTTAALGWVLVAGLGGTSAACGKFQDECHTASGAFAATYTLLDMPTGTCDAKTTGDLTKLKGDTLGFSWYETDHYSRNADTDLNTVAIQANALGVSANTYGSRKAADGTPAKDTGHKAYALGTFTTPRPDGDNFCYVDAFVPAEQDLPASPAIPPDPKKMGDKGQPALPALSVKYEWSGLRTFVDPVISGAEVEATLAYTKNGCTAHYKVLAINPLVSCLDKDKKPQDVMCDPVPRPEANHPVGSGLAFPTRCDPDLGFCVLNKPDIP